MQNGNSQIIGQEYYCSNGERNRGRKKKSMTNPKNECNEMHLAFYSKSQKANISIFS